MTSSLIRRATEADRARVETLVRDAGLPIDGIAEHVASFFVARAAGVETAYLLTTTAEEFFPRFGFERIERAAVPESVRASREFQGACPASATVMGLRLRDL